MYIYVQGGGERGGVGVQGWGVYSMESKSSKLNPGRPFKILPLDHQSIGKLILFKPMGMARGAVSPILRQAVAQNLRPGTRGGHILVYLHCCLSNYWGAQF